ncbi:MAG: lipoprotein [Pseudomonadota bacterium]
MKSPIALLPAAVLLAVTLAGCGQTGPLYMPTPPAKPANATLSSTPVMSTPAAQPDGQAQARPAPETKQQESSPPPAQ